LDQKTYYNIALSERQELNYPPFSWLIRLEIEGTKKELVTTHADKIRKKLSPSPKGIDILGPAKCYRERLRGKYRMHIMIKSNKTHDTNGEKLHSFLQDCLAVGLLNRLPSSVKILIDVNPVSVL